MLKNKLYELFKFFWWKKKKKNFNQSARILNSEEKKVPENFRWIKNANKTMDDSSSSGNGNKNKIGSDDDDDDRIQFAFFSLFF